MKTKPYNYYLSLFLISLFFMGCGNSDSENVTFLEENAPEEIVNTTQIEEKLSPVENIKEEGKNLEDTPKQIVASIGNKWIELTKEEGEWIIYNECRYGSGGMYFDEHAGWVEFSGGGDAWSSTILEMKRLDYNKILLKLKSELSGTQSEIIITSTGEDMIIFNEGEENERAFVLSSATNLVRTVDEECDEGEE